MLTEPQLSRIMPNLAPAKCQAYLPHLNQAMREHGIDTLLRSAAFVAQLAHESGEFRYMEELWGPTPAQRRYEPACDLASRLGNREAGDGRRYKGRGPIQITGRYNYQKYGSLLGIDLVGAPEQAATPAIAFATAGLYWRSNGLNALADGRQFETITRRINGGVNGLADRQRYYARALSVLGEGYVADPPVATPRGAPRWAELEPLARGSEAIVELYGELKPARRRAAPAKAPPRAAARPATTRRVAPKKATGKKATVKKPAIEPVAAKKSTAKKSAVKKAVVKKSTAKKAVIKKTARETASGSRAVGAKSTR
ncbi:MAG: glycoside hydrolase family 19 protein [Burkholderiaceae bacterium]